MVILNVLESGRVYIDRTEERICRKKCEDPIRKNRFFCEIAVQDILNFFLLPRVHIYTHKIEYRLCGKIIHLPCPY